MDDAVEKPEQVFLILQGPLSSFYSEIAEHLLQAGRTVIKVHFCGNDVMDWHHQGALRFQRPFSDWADFLEEEITPHAVTHMILHGDRRSYHQVAIKWAKRHGIKVIVSELGYLRPDWMTLERGACSTGSHFPSDAHMIRSIACGVPQRRKEVIYRDSTLDLILQELRFTIYNFLLLPMFPHYCSHRPKGPLHVYSGWLSARFRAKRARIEGEGALSAIVAGGGRFFVFALQLETDFQLRDHSPFSTVLEAITFVMKSFAAFAPQEMKLVLKPHPHEFNRKALVRSILAVADRFGLSDRVIIVEGVALGELCMQAEGFVTINSSGGFEALAAGCPTMSVMPTLYDCAGLTFQGVLDDFWQAREKPDEALFADLCNALSATIQVRGTLYNRLGRIVAAKAVAERVLSERVNEPGAYVSLPPRLEKAARMGVTYD